MDPLVWVVMGSAALSCFFALTGYSLRAYRRVQMEDRFPGVPARKRLETLERHLTALRLTTSFCRSVSNLALVVSMVYLFRQASVGAGLGRAVAATAAAAGIIAVFGVAIPSAWAAHAGEKVLAATFGILMAVRYALWPVVAVMQAFDMPIRRLSGVSDESETGDQAAKQEILQAATEGQAEGTVHPEEVEMIESVMEFGQTQAGEIMTPRTDIFALPLETDWREASRQIVAAGHTRVPVYSGDIDNIVGVLYAKDLLAQVQAETPLALRELMRKPFFVPETKPLNDLLREFKGRKVHLAIVLDEYGGTAGLVSIEDVLEEIVGDIADEYDRPEPALMHRIDERTAETDGRLHIDELNDAMALSVPEDEDYDTVAGMVFSELGYIPSAGEKLEAHGARFTVLEADERKITRLRVEKLPPDEDEETV
ncbi:MAG TPA: hypothetical protein DCX07_00015 [Phycisphaerales bacterium]|nr:hypothetical protein [Phycisphaerales bacterium]